MFKVNIIHILIYLTSLIPLNLIAAEAGKPNILFIFSDDQSYRTINALNNKEVITPTLDKLVQEGTTFTHCFNQGSWSGAVCVASRAMLNSGLNLFHAQEKIKTTPLWGETFTEAGYETFMAGKWHVKVEPIESFTHVPEIGPGMFGSTPRDGDAYSRPAPGNRWEPDDRSRKGQWLNRNGKIIHSSEHWADLAIDFLKNRAPKSEKPFFMYVAFHAPHDPRQSPTEYLEKYPTTDVQIPPNFMGEHPFDQGDHKLRDECLAPWPRTKDAIRVHRREYYAMITHMDAQIARILEALKESGEYDRTHIIFTSDHGLAVGEHGLMGKQNQYDHSVRVPMIFVGPGIAKNAKNDAMVYIHSLFPTTCDLAGITTPETVESKSLVGLLDGSETKLHDAIYGSYKSFQRMVRTEDYKLIYYPEIERTQLFNMKEDPWEIKDLAKDKKYESVIEDLMNKLHDLQDQVGDDLKI